MGTENAWRRGGDGPTERAATGQTAAVSRVRRHRLAVTPVVAALGLVLGVAGCATPTAGPAASLSTTVPERPPDSTSEYLPGLAADLYLPADGRHSAPVLVMVPGGGWTSADRSGLAALATALADSGVAVVNATYRTAPATTFPGPVGDIVCAADYGAATAARAGVTPSRLVLLGHSAGAHLAMLAALAPAHFRSGCPWPARDIDGVVGLAGPYDLRPIADAVQPLFGATPAQRPELWREGTPSTWASTRSPSPAVLLVHGEQDEVLPASQSKDFAAVLEGAGHRVELDLVPGATHGTIYRPEVVAGTISRWLAALG
jgi:acetyl esterase/lipase